MTLSRLLAAALGAAAMLTLAAPAEAATHRRSHPAHVQTATHHLPAHRAHIRHVRDRTHPRAHTRLTHYTAHPRHHGVLRGS